MITAGKPWVRVEEPNRVCIQRACKDFKLKPGGSFVCDVCDLIVFYDHGWTILLDSINAERTIAKQHQ